MVVVLLIIGLGLDKRMPQPRFLAAWMLRARLNRSLGLLTPLLPCGPHWLIRGAAAITGTWFGGATLMAAFVAATIPLPLLIQSQAVRLQGRFSPGLLRSVQQGIALLSAAILGWRATLSLEACCQ